MEEEVDQLLQAMMVEIDRADRDARVMSAYDPRTPPVEVLSHVRLEELVTLIERTVRRHDDVEHDATAVSRPIPTPVSLPIEIQRIILSSLTWATVMRCRLVCRFWANAVVKWITRIPDCLRLNPIVWHSLLGKPIPLAREQCLFLAQFERLTRLRLDAKPLDFMEILPHLDNRFAHLEEVALNFIRDEADTEAKNALMDRLRVFLDGLHAYTRGRFTSLSLNTLDTEYCLECDSPYDTLTAVPCRRHEKDSYFSRLLQKSSFGPYLKTLELRGWSRRWTWRDSSGASSLTALTELRMVSGGGANITGYPKLCSLPRLFAETLRVLVVDTCQGSSECIIHAMAKHGKVLEKLVINCGITSAQHIGRHLPFQTMYEAMTRLQPPDAGLSKLATFIYSAGHSRAHTAIKMDMVIQVMRLARDSLETLILHGPVRWSSPELVDFSELCRLQTLSIEEYPSLLDSITMEQVNRRIPGCTAAHRMTIHHNGRAMLKTLPIHGVDRVELSIFSMSTVTWMLRDPDIWKPLEHCLSYIISDGASVRHLVLRLMIHTDRISTINELHAVARLIQHYVASHLNWNPTTLLKRLTLAVAFHDNTCRCLAYIPITFSAR